MSNDEADEVTEELFQSFLFRYLTKVETSIKGSDFFLDSFHLVYYKCCTK